MYFEGKLRYEVEQLWKNFEKPLGSAGFDTELIKIHGYSFVFEELARNLRQISENFQNFTILS